MVLGVSLMFGGFVQLVGGIIQLRVGNTFGGMLFTGFGSFWLAVFFIFQFHEGRAPAQVGQGVGLFLYAFGIFAAMMFLASFRTDIVVVVALALLTATLFVLGAALNTASLGVIAGTSPPGSSRPAGGLGIAGLAIYLSLAGLFEATYGREVLPVGRLAKPSVNPLGSRGKPGHAEKGVYPWAVTRTLPPEHRRPGGVLGRGSQGNRLVSRADGRAGQSNPPFYRWFPDGVLNTCFNALDRHVARRPRRPARADLRQPGDRHLPHLHLLAVA